MESRLGRNDRCWCGSGKKFKKCHLNRETAPRRTIQEIIETAQAAYAQKVCLHPGPSTCKGGIIKAHSIQQTGGLSKIAVKGKVYGVRENNIGDLSKHNGLIAPKRVGVGHASTFSGMCGFGNFPTFDFEGNTLQRLVKSFHKLPDTEIGDAVVRYAFEYCENRYMFPTWWDALDQPKKMVLCRRSTEAADVAVKRKNVCLMYDGVNYVNWTVTARECNLIL